MVRWLWVTGLIVACVGCSRRPPTHTYVPPVVPNTARTDFESRPLSKEAELYEKVRSGFVQTAGAVDSIIEALEHTEGLLRRARGQQRDALADVRELLDDSGAALGDYVEDPPDLTTFRAKMSAYDKRRLAAITACNDAVVDLKSARAIVGSLLAAPAPPLKSELEQLDVLVGVAIQDLTEAIEALGGKLEPLE